MVEMNKKQKKEKLDDIDGQIEVLQEAIQDNLDEDNIDDKEGLEELIKELEQAIWIEEMSNFWSKIT